jgi:hypothetical protein
MHDFLSGSSQIQIELACQQSTKTNFASRTTSLVYDAQLSNSSQRRKMSQPYDEKIQRKPNVDSVLLVPALDQLIIQLPSRCDTGVSLAIAVRYRRLAAVDDNPA